MTAATILASSRQASGVTQAELARRSGTSQPDISVIERGDRVPTFDTMERLVGRLRHTLISIPVVRDDAPRAAANISSALAGNADDVAFRSFLDYSDGLAAETGVNRVALTIARPQKTGSIVWDAALAAVAEYWLNRGRLPKPAWLTEAGRYLGEPTAPHLSKYDLEPDIDEVPREFLKRNLLIEQSTLASV
ncbi:MAG: helix-turn-helix transcriptional regulator [Actinomycetota bacterium]